MEDTIVKGGSGRPKKKGSFDRVLKFCASEEHEYMKRALEEELDKNGGEVLREALEILYKFEAK